MRLFTFFSIKASHSLIKSVPLHLGVEAAVITCDNRFFSNQLLAAGKDCGALAWSALPFLCWLKLGKFLWAVLTPQSSVAILSCVNEAL
jgi:hypothetical protein